MIPRDVLRQTVETREIFVRVGTFSLQTVVPLHRRDDLLLELVLPVTNLHFFVDDGTFPNQSR